MATPKNESPLRKRLLGALLPGRLLLTSAPVTGMSTRPPVAGMGRVAMGVLVCGFSVTTGVV